jgi:hypothetical protein
MHFHIHEACLVTMREQYPLKCPTCKRPWDDEPKAAAAEKKIAPRVPTWGEQLCPYLIAFVAAAVFIMNIALLAHGGMTDAALRRELEDVIYRSASLRRTPRLRALACGPAFAYTPDKLSSRIDKHVEWRRALVYPLPQDGRHGGVKLIGRDMIGWKK